MALNKKRIPGASAPIGRTAIADLKNPDTGKIGSQGFTRVGVEQLINHATGIEDYAKGRSLKETLDALRSDPWGMTKVDEFLERTPIETTELPDGPIWLQDGHHRAFLADQIGKKDLPSRTKGLNDSSNTPIAEPPAIGRDGTGEVNGYRIGPNADLKFANLRGADLAGADLEGADLESANLRRAKLEGANLQGANLEGANLERACLDSANLEGACLIGAQLDSASLELHYKEGITYEESRALKGANLKGADLRGANLSNARLERTILEGANLAGANLEGATLKSMTTEKANLSRANLKNAKLSYLLVINTNLSGAVLDGAKLTMAQILGSDLSGASFIGAKIDGFLMSDIYGKDSWEYSTIKKCNLSYVDFSNADIQRTNISDCDLSNANMFETRLVHVNIQDSDLFSADLKKLNTAYTNFSSDNLTYADFSDAELRSNFEKDNLNKTNFRGAKIINARTGLFSGNFRENKYNKTSFRDADLFEPRFIGIPLGSSDFTNANIEHPDFSGNVDARRARFKGANFILNESSRLTHPTLMPKSLRDKFAEDISKYKELRKSAVESDPRYIGMRTGLWIHMTDSPQTKYYGELCVCPYEEGEPLFDSRGLHGVVFEGTCPLFNVDVYSYYNRYGMLVPGKTPDSWKETFKEGFLDAKNAKLIRLNMLNYYEDPDLLKKFKRAGIPVYLVECNKEEHISRHQSWANDEDREKVRASLGTYPGEPTRVANPGGGCCVCSMPASLMSAAGHVFCEDCF